MRISGQPLFLIGLILLGVGFAFAFVRVLELRFSSEELYPYYASHRDDPLGASALHESLDRLEGVSAERNFTALTQISTLDGDSALFLIGLPRTSYGDLRAKDDSPVLRAVKEEGARLVITLNPELVPAMFAPKASSEEEDWLERRRALREKRKEELRKGTGEKDGEQGEEGESEEVSSGDLDELETRMEAALGPRLSDFLGAEVADVEKFERPDRGWRTRPGRTLSEEGMPANTPNWRSQYRFGDLAEEWREAVVVGKGKSPVVIERKLGRGSVVLATDSYFASNEALHFEGGDNADFLLWLTGGKSRVIFDETIHGSTVSGGAMKLIRKLRLHGFFYGLLVFVALWAWRSASSLAPGDEAIERGLVSGAAVSGERSESGFVRLLRRSLPAGELIGQCVNLHRESTRTPPVGKVASEIEAAVEKNRERPREFPPAAAYRRIAEILRKR